MQNIAHQVIKKTYAFVRNADNLSVFFMNLFYCMKILTNILIPINKSNLFFISLFLYKHLALMQFHDTVAQVFLIKNKASCASLSSK